MGVITITADPVCLMARENKTSVEIRAVGMIEQIVTSSQPGAFNPHDATRPCFTPGRKNSCEKRGGL